MLPIDLYEHQITVLMIASKFDEIDDNIVQIRDLKDYIRKQLQQQHNRRSNDLVPQFEDIVECERRILAFFEWDLKFILPIHMLRAFLANGVLFTNEFNQQINTGKSEATIKQRKDNWSIQIQREALSISDLIISKGSISQRNESSSDIAASIIYLARKNILEADSPTGEPLVPVIWPQELVILTRCTENKAKKILVEVLQPLEKNSNQK